MTLPQRITRNAGGTYDIPIRLIEPGPNVRGEDVGDVSELALSMTKVGQLTPVIVEMLPGKRFRLIEGHRRRKGAIEAGRGHLEAIIRSPITDRTERMIKQLAMHANTRQFDPIAEARALHELMFERNMSREEIATSIGKTPEWVRDRIALLRLSEDEQAAVTAREMPLRVAVEVVRERRDERDGRTRTRPRWNNGVPRRHCPSCSCNQPGDAG